MTSRILMTIYLFVFTSTIFICAQGVKNDLPWPRMTGECSAGFFPCNDSEICVEQRKNCDQKEDCPDGSDEWHCEDHSRKDFWDRLFKKRPDEDREQRMTGCELWAYPSECSCSKTSLFCNHKGFEKIPDLMPRNVQETDLSGNQFHFLRRSDFPSLPDLETLILTSSEITLLKTESFGNLVNLKNLYLTSNRISVIENGTFWPNSNLKLLVLSHNPISVLSPGAFLGLRNLEELDIRDCKLQSVPSSVFYGLLKLKVLWLDGNNLRKIPKKLFHDLRRLKVMSLSRNYLTSMESVTFLGLDNLQSLAVSQNKIYFLDSKSFGNLSNLLKLDLHGNSIRTIEREAFELMTKLESLKIQMEIADVSFLQLAIERLSGRRGNLKKNPLKDLREGTFDSLTALTHIYFDEFHLCSLALHVRVCEPRSDGISSVAHLLDSVVLRVAVWAVAAVAALGNLAVLAGRAMLSEPNAVHAFYIKNLALADLMMAAYLFAIAGHDVWFRGHYLQEEARWRRSSRCHLLGALATLSSEASVLVIAVITADRYTSIMYPLSLKRRTKISATIAMVTVWSVAMTLSALPMWNLGYYGPNYYGTNGVCLPLQIHAPFGPGWEYSAFVFCGLNLAAFALVAAAYAAMFSSIARSQAGLRCSQQQQDRAIARRFALIVATDCLCWVPIVAIKAAAMAGVPIQADLYAWVAVFLLPVNSALNPVLYTLTTKLFKQHLAKIVYKCRHQNQTISTNDASGISMTSLNHDRNSKRTIVTTFVENDSNSFNRTSLVPTPSPVTIKRHQNLYDADDMM